MTRENEFFLIREPWSTQYNGPARHQSCTTLQQSPLIYDLCLSKTRSEKSTRKRKPRRFQFLRFEELCRKALFSWRVNVDRGPNCKNKAVFSNFSGVVWTENIWCVFRVKSPFSNSSCVGWTGLKTLMNQSDASGASNQNSCCWHFSANQVQACFPHFPALSAGCKFYPQAGLLSSRNDTVVNYYLQDWVCSKPGS